MDLSVVIVNYHSRDPLLRSLAALEAGGGPAEREIVVVDNAPGDGTAEALAREFPAVRVIANTENVGFGRAVNRGLAATTGALVLVLNPDCDLQPGALQALADHLASHPECGVVGPRTLNTDGTLEYSARAYPDHYTFLFNRYSLLTKLFPNNRHSRRYLMSNWDHATVRNVDWLAGHCLLLKREAIDEVGPLDEAFFMFNEDVDWCRRMNLAGWDVTFVPHATVVHHVGASRGKVSARVVFERHRGMIHYFHKHHPKNPAVMLAADTLILARAALMLTKNALRRR